MCSLSLESLRKWRTKREVAGLKTIFSRLVKFLKNCFLNIRQRPIWPVSWSIYWSVIRDGLHGRVAVKKPFLSKGNREKRLRYAKWHKNWTENQWQQVLWRDESSPEPRPQHYWSSLGSFWQGMKQQAANIQSRALDCPPRSLENYSFGLRFRMSLTGQILTNQILTFKFVRIVQIQLYFSIFFHVYTEYPIHVCTHFNRSLHPFLIFLVIHK